MPPQGLLSCCCCYCCCSRTDGKRTHRHGLCCAPVAHDEHTTNVGVHNIQQQRKLHLLLVLQQHTVTATQSGGQHCLPGTGAGLVTRRNRLAHLNTRDRDSSLSCLLCKQFQPTWMRVNGKSSCFFVLRLPSTATACATVALLSCCCCCLRPQPAVAPAEQR